MSYGYLFVTDRPSDKLGKGRRRFWRVLEASGKNIYFRFEDEEIRFVETDHDRGGFRPSAQGIEFFRELHKESGQFLFSYALLLNKEGEEDYAGWVLKEKPSKVNVCESPAIRPRELYVFVN